ncbi:MAG: sensor histidine kinase [Nitrosopumilaceae archaeon]|nr:sensor histidine kinase [Nitrosopumilaceae archaeon]
MPDVKINVLHTLENFREAYDDESSVVVLEALANALDAKATEVDVRLADRHISFRDNGPGMNGKQFKKYHDISASAKRKGAGIGFAGVGAKVYLAVWKQTAIHTETHGPDGPLASDLRVTHGKVRWEPCPTSTSIGTHGTLYDVKLREKDYERLLAGIRDIILDQFNPAMLAGLCVTVNGSTLEPWRPPHETRIDGTVRVKKRDFPVALTICKDEVPSKYRYVQYQVWGKTITTKRLDWVADIREQYRNRVHCLVNAEPCSKYLKLDKGSFKGGPGMVADMYGAVDRWLHKTLRDKGYVEARGGDVQRSAKISKFFKNLFKDPRYRWLNPGAAAGSGPGAGSDGGVAERGKATRQRETVKAPDGKKRTGSGSRGGSGLNIITAYKEGDPRDGWIDPESNDFVCNTAHPLYRKYTRNADARNLRVKQVMFSALITHGAKNRPVDAAEAFETHRDLMTQARNLEVPV